MRQLAQFNRDRTYPGRWTVTFPNPPIYDDRRIGSPAWSAAPGHPGPCRASGVKY